MINKYYRNGVIDYLEGRDSPHNPASKRYELWSMGWHAAREVDDPEDLSDELDRETVLNYGLARQAAQDNPDVDVWSTFTAR
jgi:hypothetical protein